MRVAFQSAGENNDDNEPDENYTIARSSGQPHFSRGANACRVSPAFLISLSFAAPLTRRGVSSPVKKTDVKKFPRVSARRAASEVPAVASSSGELDELFYFSFPSGKDEGGVCAGDSKGSRSNLRIRSTSSRQALLCDQRIERQVFSITIKKTFSVKKLN